MVLRAAPKLMGAPVDVNSEDQLAEGIEAHHHADWLMAYAMLIQRTVTERR